MCVCGCVHVPSLHGTRILDFLSVLHCSFFLPLATSCNDVSTVCLCTYHTCARTECNIPDCLNHHWLCRTSGEMRISNFMLWDLAYSELYFSEKLWPEFCARDLDDALLAYTSRNRRFGAGAGSGTVESKPRTSIATASAAQQ